MSCGSLQTPRATIRPVASEDADFFYELMNSPGWLKFIGDRGIHTVDDARRQIERTYLPSATEYGLGYYVIIPNDTENPVGVCGFLKRDTMQNPDFGFAMLPTAQGRGLALEACSSLLNHARNAMDIKVLDAVTRLDNVKSMRLLDRLNFSRLSDLESNGEQLAHFRWMPD